MNYIFEFYYQNKQHLHYTLDVRRMEMFERNVELTF